MDMIGALGETVRMNSSEAMSETVVTAVANTKGVDPLDLEPLYDSIDPDALDSLFGHTTAESSITELSFEMADCEVLIRGNGKVVVTPPTVASNNEDHAISHE